MGQELLEEFFTDFFVPPPQFDVMQHRIYLIGYRGAGKSTIGSALAKALGTTWVDTDHLVCRNRGAVIANIVALEGWDGFRKHEAEALKESSDGDALVIATGGGAVLHQEVWSIIKKKAFIVWLYADIDTLVERLSPHAGSDSGRPSLTGTPVRQEVEKVLSERVELYRSLADVKVDTGRLAAVEAVEEIVLAYRKWCGENRS